ncbi:MAG: 50S ribosomal protein L5 [Leptospirillia bacterium]
MMAEKKAPAPAKSGKTAKPKKDVKGKETAAPAVEAVRTKSSEPRLKIRYFKEIQPNLMSELKLSNVMQVPKIVKVTLNVALGEAIGNPKLLDMASKELALITGQKPVMTKARKSIAGFKLREGMPIGVMVTLRGDIMWEFLDRLISIALPRIRDFKGVNDRSFDGNGNYSLGLKEQIIFPEIKYDEITMTHGFDISIVTTAKDNVTSKALLTHLGMPFRK